MSVSPETRPSLLIRIRNQGDAAAWSEFTEIYRPLIYRLACHRGLQHADADDLAQQVLLAVARAISRWENDPARARFRTWLHRVATNAILNALTRAPADRGSGDSALEALLVRHPAVDGPTSDFVRLEHRRDVFRWAARQIRSEFHPSTWDAFWLTAVDGRGADEVARELNLSRGSVYAARSRVMRRLREKVLDWDAEPSGSAVAP
jgi:RNA polymerase sigma-70 factor (ECF subfamily)